jgi:hypothetical protein
LTDALIGYAMFGWAPFGCLVVGLLYLATSPRSVPPLARLLPASYAPLSAFLYLAIAFATPSGRGAAMPVALFFTVQAVPLFFMAVSVRVFRGPRWVHTVLMPVALICMAWQFAWGYWGVYGK